LKANDQQKIYEISYHVDTRNYITDSSLRKQYVKYASENLKKYRIAPRIKWFTEQIPGGASWLYIPLFAESDTTAIQATITLRFPPAVVSNKVYDFRIEKTLDFTKSKGVIEAPKRSNR
jgi:hypothetical protein